MNEYLILKGAVCIPDMPDSVGDVLSEQQIREACLFFTRNSNLIDVQHTLRPVARPLESQILESEIEFNNNTYPKGTWFISCEIFDSEIEQAIADGEYTGFSIFAAPQRSVDEMRRPMKPLPKDLKFSQVSSWKPVSVSIVDKPSHGMATFEVYDSDDDFIRKWNPNNPNLMEEQDMVEEKADNQITCSESFFEKIINKIEGVRKSNPAPQEPVKPADKNNKLEELEKKIDKILELLTTLDGEEPAEETPEGVRKYVEIDGVKYFPENGEVDNSEDDETNLNESEPQGITKSLDIDLLQNTNNHGESLSLMERIGRTPSGLKKN